MADERDEPVDDTVIDDDVLEMAAGGHARQINTTIT